MSRQAKGQKVGAAFFPFLAVLICTMGALIVLFVLLVQHTRVDSAAIAATKKGADGDDRRVRERLEDAQWQRELLEKSRAEKTEELTEARSRVAHLEEHTQRLAAQAKELLERAKAIDEGKKLREEDTAAARAEAAKLKAEIEKKKDELEKAKKKPQDGQEWYALIPYDGRAGTRRRPIYVECTEFGVVIQPEGILLRAEDFNGPLGPGNPLDSALRAIREHWEKTAGKQAAQPYPLLVVRPSGVVAFGAAKAAISAWDDEWGYELISDDKHLDFGPPDPALNAALSKSVAVSRQRQAAMVAMTPRRFQGEEPLRSFTPEPTIAAGASRYIGGAGGGASGGSGLGINLGSGPGGSGANGTAGSGAGGGTGGQPGGGMARSGGGYGNGLGMGAGTGGGNSVSPGTGIGGAAGGQAAGMNRGGAGGYGGGGYGAGGTGGASGYGSASGTGGSGIPSVTGGLNGGNAGQSENLVGRNAASAVGGTGGGGGGDAFPGSTTNGGGTGPGGSSYGTGSGQSGSGQAGAGGTGQAGGGQFIGSSSGQSFAGSGGGGQSGNTMSDSSSGGGSSSGATSGASSGGGSPFGGSSMSAGSSGGMGVPSLNFGGAKSAPSGAGGGKGGSGSPNSTAKRGKNWALPQTKQNQTGVTRHIRVSLQPDRVVMLPEAGDNRAPQVVKIAPEMTPDNVTHFVSAVQNEVKGWGLAVADGYWKPTLQVEVAPGAERQYLNLETALHGSGIEIIRR